AWDQICERMLAVEDTVQLPIRFFAAAQEVSSPEAKTLLAKLLDKAVEKVADLPGVTMVLADNSGSGAGWRISGKSKLLVADVVKAILAKKLGRRAVIGVFGDSMIWVLFSPEESTLSIKTKIDSIAQHEERSKYGALAIPDFKKGAGVGGGTETGLWFALDD